MMPLRAALSNCDSTADTVSSPFVAFLKSVLRRVFTSRFRLVRFSDWRVHLMAALMFGKVGSVEMVIAPGEGAGHKGQDTTNPGPRHYGSGSAPTISR